MKKLLPTLLFLFVQNSFAMTIPGAYVYSEEGGSEEAACGITSSSSTAAVESILRQNRINIEPEISNYTVYVNNNALIVSNICVVNSSLQVYFGSFVEVPSEKSKLVFGPVELCSKGFIISGPAYDIQTRINEKLKDISEQCISKIEKKQLIKSKK